LSEIYEYPIEVAANGDTGLLEIRPNRSKRKSPTV
jgi:hypothetical protein